MSARDRQAGLVQAVRGVRPWGWRAFVTVAFACFFAVSAVLMHFRLGGSRVAIDYDDLAEWVAAWSAAGWCLWASRRGAPPMRRFWGLLAASTFVWGAGQAVWVYYEVVLRGQAPFPSLADVGFLAAAPLMVAALLAFPVAPLRSLARAVVLLDGGLVAAATLFVSWTFVLGPLYSSHQGDTLSQVVALAYPACDALVIVVLLSLAERASRSARLPLGLVAGGVLALAFSDSAFAYLSQSGSYGLGLNVDIGWIAGFLLIALAPIWTTGDPSGRRVVADQPSRVALLIPYLPLAGALAVATGYLVTGRSLSPVLFAVGLVAVVILACRQLLALLDSVSLNSQQAARFAALVQGSSDLTTIVSSEGTIAYQSPSSAALLGWPPERLTDRPFKEFVHPDEVPSFLRTLAQVTRRPGGEATAAWRLRHQGDQYISVESHLANLLDDPNVRGVTINSRDVSERRQLEHELRDQAVHDLLTGLPNRTLLNDRLDHAFAVQQRDRDHHDLAVVLLDLDEFKSVNDSLGHAAGDELLCAVARRLESAVRDADTVARMGGDEFAVVLDSTFSAADTDDTADRILAVFERPFLLGGEQHIVDASVGIAVSNGDTANAMTLLQEADIAMHAAKLSGKNGRKTYKPGMHEEVIDRFQLEADLRHAVDRNELVVVYQPLVDLATGTLSGVEALMRWQHPTRGLLAPGSFIPAAETSGLIIPMGRWLLRQACSDLRNWDRLTAAPLLRLNVNISARQLDDPDLAADVATALAGSQLDPARLTLEITETVLLSDFDSVITVLAQLKALGVELSIDDFGTGYSSLSYLSRLPVDEIKVDQSFIAAMTEGGDAASVVHTIIRLADDLHLRTVAEGVETQLQLDQLHQTTCELVQGYLLDPPLSEQQVSHRLQHGTSSLPSAPPEQIAVEPVGGASNGPLHPERRRTKNSRSFAEPAARAEGPETALASQER